MATTYSMYMRLRMKLSKLCRSGRGPVLVVAKLFDGGHATHDERSTHVVTMLFILIGVNATPSGVRNLVGRQPYLA